MEKLISRKEAAKLLGISIGIVHDHVRPNQISVFPPACRFRPCPADAG